MFQDNEHTKELKKKLLINKAVVLAIRANGYLIATNKKCFHGLSHNVNINIICTNKENCFFGGCTLTMKR